MNVQSWFSVPIYQNFVTDKNFDSIQEKFKFIFSEIKNKEEFSHFFSGNHLVSGKANFEENLLERYNCDVFYEELNYHIFKYLTLINAFDDSYQYYVRESWMTLTRKTEYALVHSHGYSDISGVYYFQTNQNDGDLIFHTPVLELESSYVFHKLHETIKYKPQVGKIILFPGWLKHGTETNMTDSERISISFNIIFKR